MLRVQRSLFVLVVVLLARPFAPWTAQAAPLSQAAQGEDPSLGEARRFFESLDYERTVAAVDRALMSLLPRGTDPVARQATISAYEMRARSRFGLGNQQGAREDFQALLKLAPAFRLSGQVSPRVVTLLEEMRTQVVGQVVLAIAPADARIELDGAPWDAAPGPVPLAAGQHTLRLERPGYRPLVHPFTVVAGVSQDVAVTLERVSASLAIVTSPAGVDVLVNGASRGRTEPALPKDAAAAAAKLQVAPTVVSQPFVIPDLPTGAHTIELRRECFTVAERRVSIETFTDLQIEPIKMTPAVASIEVSASEGIVLLDDAPRGNAPVLLTDVCEGSHVVEVRSPYGRLVRRISPRAGDSIKIDGTLKPAFAILSVSGLPEGLRGGADLRVAVERALGGSTSATLFAPTADRADQALRAAGLVPGWLAFDKLRRPIGDAAANIAPQVRQELSRQLAKALDVQGVAAISVTSSQDRNLVLVSLLAAGSSEPDVLEVKIDSTESVAAAISRLDVPLSHLRPTAGLLVVDVLDVPGPIVMRVDRTGPVGAAGVMPGDMVTMANGKPIADSRAFQAVLAALPNSARLHLELRDRAGLAKRAEMTTVLAPRAVALTDQTVLFNKLLLDLRARLVTASGTFEEPVVRLNAAIALMRLGNWTDALGELERTRLSPGSGVSAGTVLYLLALCHEALGQFGEAEKAFREAATHKEAVISDDGPTVAELVAARSAKGRQ